MRATFAVVTILTSLFYTSARTKFSSDEVQELSDNFALHEILVKLMQYLDEDQDFRAMINYIQQNSEWKELLQKGAEVSDWVDLKEWLNLLGKNLDKWFASISSFVDTAEVTDRIGEESLKAFMEDLRYIIPTDAIKESLFKDVADSRLVMKMFENEKFKNVAMKFLRLETVKAILRIIDATGIPVIKWIKLVDIMYDWGQWDI